jgi:hypothetical protein
MAAFNEAEAATQALHDALLAQLKRGR